MTSLESEDTHAGTVGAPEPSAGRAALREESASRAGRAQMLVMLGSVLAGLSAFGVGEAVYDIVPAKRVQQQSEKSDRPVMRPSVETQHIAAAQNASLAFGAFGLFLGAFLGAAGGLARRSASAALTGGVVGAVLGTILGAGVTRALVASLITMARDGADKELRNALLMHGLIWGLLGASAGLAFAMGLGDRRHIGRAVAGGFLGALLGAVAYEIIGALVFVYANTHHVLSETWATRLLAYLLVALGTGAAQVLMLFEPRSAVAKRAVAGATGSPAQ
jgi:hypothetical protein